ncbi:unnamed protein product [marine sediment metagenome]|uniref:Uncharacterized protein n=1 Tax=marine sediment metagenome TaxID=412755 RepID=X1J2P9_9ZZZZ
MTKLKRARTLMAIILVSIFGWVAIVGLVIKPGIVAGAFLCLAGGSIIGLVIAYLIRRWWFRRSLADRMVDVLKDDENDGS